MPVGDDEERAAIWRAQRARRPANRARLEAQLAGDPAAAAAVYDHWRAIIERDDPNEVDTEDGTDERSKVIANL